MTNSFIRFTRLLVAMSLALFSATAAVAQQTGSIQGTVFNAATGEPVVGAQVFVPGTTLGTLSNEDGRYMVRNVPAGNQVIRVEVIGYSAQSAEVEVPAGGMVLQDFRLTTSAIALDEVVVTGQGRELQRREIGTSVASVNTESIDLGPVKSMSDLLQGRAAGVNILPGGGKVGQGTKVVLRGPGSFSQNIEPVIYVDGVRIDNSKTDGVWTGGTSWSGLDDINPADVERVEIVKGAAAATLYGTEASAGVIQIFTKRGREGASNRWNYRGEYGFANTPRDWWDVSVYSDWFYDNYVETAAPLTEHQLSTSGGLEGFSYYASGTIREKEGILPNNNEGYQSFRANLQVFPRQDLVVRFNTGYSNREVAMPQDANNIYGYGINALTAGPQGNFMPIEDISLIEVGYQSGRFTGGSTVEYNPMDNFTNRLVFGVDIINTDNTDFHPYGANRFNPQGRKEVYRRDATTLTVEYNGTYSLDFGPNISSSTSFGFQAYNKDVGVANAYGEQFPAPGLSTVGAAAVTSGWEYRLTTKSAGFFVQEHLGFMDRLFVTVGVRADGHSAFGEDYPYEIYPKIAGSFVASEYDFVPDFFSTLRFRAAYGTAGQQPGAFDAVRTWAAASAFEGEPAVTPLNIGNPDLAPEVSHEIEVGVDFSILDDRFSMEATYFNQRTEGALLPVQYPPSDGFLSTQLENVGEIRNEGLELSAGARILESEDFRWNVTANLMLTENEVTDLGDLPELYVQWTQATREGFPVGAFFGDRYIVEDGQAIEVTDQPELGKDNPGYIGPAFPTRTFQFSTSARLFNRVNVNALLDHSAGNYTESATIRWLTRLEVPEGDEVVPELAGQRVASFCHTTDDPALLAFCENPWPSGGRGNVVMPADFWKLREISVTYDVPPNIAQLFRLNDTQVYVTGRNIWRSIETLSMEAEADYDTEDQLSNQEYFITPIPRQFVFGLRVSF